MRGLGAPPALLRSQLDGQEWHSLPRGHGLAGLLAQVVQRQRAPLPVQGRQRAQPLGRRRLACCRWGCAGCRGQDTAWQQRSLALHGARGCHEGGRPPLPASTAWHVLVSSLLPACHALPDL